jgi:acyl-CoA thioester hydrolase
MAGSVFQHTHRVVYAECTVGNHVYYSRYLDILEAARGEFFRQLGSPLRQLQEAGSIFPVIGLDISYKAPARYDDVLTVEVWITELGGVRLTFAFRVLSASAVLLAEGQTRHICATPDEKPKRLPKDLMDLLRPFLH